MAVIHDPGKFEGETEFVRACWYRALDGFEDETFNDGDTLVSVFLITADDYAQNPDDLSAADVGRFLCLWESDQGFVNSAIHDRASLDRIIAECEADAKTED